MRGLFSRRPKPELSPTDGSAQSSNIFPTGIQLLYKQENSLVDIIFIHGLTGDRERTWTAKEASSPWPKTLLPLKFPESRILTFGYDAHVTQWRGVVSQSRIGHHAWKLLTALSTYREEDDTNERPIIFVCHSLGGLVCEDALVTSKQRSEPHLHGIIRSTRGIIFLGTPHHGAGLARWAEMLAKAIGHIKQANRKVVQVLQRDSEVLARIQDSFHTMIMTQNKEGNTNGLPPIEITCFYEELPLPGIGLVVPQHSAILPGYIPIGIHANHMDIAKFDSVEDPGFVAMCGELRRWLKGLKADADINIAAMADTSGQQMSKARVPCETPECTESLQSYWLVPFGRNRDFVGREDMLESILKVLPPGVDEDNCQRTVIEGLGGVGKTQIALQAAFRTRDQYPDCSVFWVPAVDVLAFENAYREIGRQLKVKGVDDDKADVGLLVKTALSESAGRWLLIVDNADDVELLFGNAGATPLVECLPFNRNGSILFTTRNHEVTMRLDISPRNSFITGEMSRDEAIKMLQRHLTESQTRDAESINVLLDFLTNLPLAIRQASAYISKTGMSVAKYLQHCQSSDSKLVTLLSKDFVDRDRYKNIKNPVTTTWLISFQHISRDNKLSAQYLRFMCLLAEKDIPASLLPPADGKLGGNEDDELEKDEAIGILKAYAFISERMEASTFDMHRLVRLAMRNWLKQEANGTSVSAVIQRLANVFPFPRHENRDLWIKYLPHAQSAFSFVAGAGDTEVESDLLSNIGSSLDRLGKYQESGAIHRQTLELREKLLGREHPSTLKSMNNVAEALRCQGAYQEARQMHQQTLELREKMLGQENPDTLESMNNLAEILRYLGKLDSARQLHQQTLELRGKVLGKEHPSTLDTMNNLALALRGLGKFREAEEMHRKELKISEKVLGREHPETLDSMHNLAIALYCLGKYNEAELLHRQEWGLNKQVLGKEHPSSLISMLYLAIVLQHQGKYDEAKQMLQQGLQLTEKVLGKEHPLILDNMSALANVLNGQGKYEEAYDLQEQALKGCNRLFGPEDSSTLDCSNDLAVILHNQRKYLEAEQILRQTLKRRENLVGKEHPDCLYSMYNLAEVLYSQGRAREAEKLHWQTLKLSEKVLGKEHPDTLASRNIIAETSRAKEEGKSYSQ